LILSSMLYDNVLLLVILWSTSCATKVLVVLLLIHLRFISCWLSPWFHLLVRYGFNSGSDSVFGLGHNGSSYVLVVY
jgi:hypothetical protein